MTLRRRLLLVTIPLMIGLGGTAAYAQLGPTGEMGNGPQRGAFEEGRGAFIERMADELNLSEAQRAEIRAIHEQARTENQEVVQQLRNEMDTMRSLMASDASADQLRQQHNRVQQLQEQVSDQMFETRLAIREVLTPEQRAQISEMRPQRFHDGRGFREGRGPRGDRNQNSL